VWPLLCQLGFFKWLPFIILCVKHHLGKSRIGAFWFYNELAPFERHLLYFSPRVLADWITHRSCFLDNVIGKKANKKQILRLWASNFSKIKYHYFYGYNSPPRVNQRNKEKFFLHQVVPLNTLTQCIFKTYCLFITWRVVSVVQLRFACIAVVNCCHVVVVCIRWNKFLKYRSVSCCQPCACLLLICLL